MTKLHPHLKAFIRNTVLAEMTGPSESYKYKEEMMKRIQTDVLEKLDTIATQEQLAQLIDNATTSFKLVLINDLDMISRTLKAVPIAVLKKITKS
jgi:rRNA-processing protein FCF1